MELGLRGVELVCGVVGVDEKLDLGAHGAERAALHHDVLVIVSGGSVTTRTCAAGAATWRAAFR